MIPTVVIIALIAIGIPAWLCRRFEAPPTLNGPVALRYLLMCLLMFLSGLLAMGDPLLVQWATWAMVGAALFSGMLVLVLANAVCQNRALR